MHRDCRFGLASPRDIWLFGSRARGTAAADSDWDLLVVVPDELAPAGFDDPMTVWDVKRDSGVRADVHVCRACEFDEDRAIHNTIAYDAAVEGVQLMSAERVSIHTTPSSLVARAQASAARGATEVSQQLQRLRDRGEIDDRGNILVPWPDDMKPGSPTDL